MSTAPLAVSPPATQSPCPAPQLFVVGTGLSARSFDLREPEVTIGRGEGYLLELRS